MNVVHRELTCLRHKIHMGLFLTLILADMSWIFTALIQVGIKGFSECFIQQILIIIWPPWRRVGFNDIKHVSLCYYITSDDISKSSVNSLITWNPSYSSKTSIFKNIRIGYFPSQGFLNFTKKGITCSIFKIYGWFFACKINKIKDVCGTLQDKTVILINFSKNQLKICAQLFNINKSLK